MQKSTTMVVPPDNAAFAPLEVVRRDRPHELQFQMGVRIDSSRQDVTSAGIDHVRARGHVNPCSDGHDRTAIDEHVGPKSAVVIHDRAAANEHCHWMRTLSRDVVFEL
jgi:hypothetical protein